MKANVTGVSDEMRKAMETVISTDFKSTKALSVTD
jgi:hypothetical protein